MLQKQSRDYIVLGTLVFDRRANHDWPRRRSFMPDAWNAAIYRERAAAWRDKAATLPEDSRVRDVCQEIAQAYDELADLIEQLPKYRPG
jgi:hypothetical protein